jgi:predicted nucleic acid-binding protein
LIIDTDVIIWYLRGDEAAKRVIEQNIPFSISVITYMELIQGMINKDEMKKFQSRFKNGMLILSKLIKKYPQGRCFMFRNML